MDAAFKANLRVLAFGIQGLVVLISIAILI